MHRGYIKLWRKSLDSQIWQNAGLWQLWCYCLMKANHKPAWVGIDTGRGSTEVFVDRGQFLFGRKKAAKETKQKPRTVYKRLLKLKNIGNLDIQTNSHYSLVSICNWDEYQCDEIGDGQASGQAMDRQGPGKGQAMDTNKNEKNKTTTTAADGRKNADDGRKNPSSAVEKKCILFDSEEGEFKNISSRDLDRWSKAYPAVNISTEILSAAEWVIANPKNRKSNWRRFLINWLKRAQEKAPRISNTRPKKMTYEEQKQKMIAEALEEKRT